MVPEHDPIILSFYLEQFKKVYTHIHMIGTNLSRRWRVQWLPLPRRLCERQGCTMTTISPGRREGTRT